MSPDQLLLIRQNLDTACRFLEPGPAARQAFRAGLLSLLLQTGRVKDEQEGSRYLAGMLRHTCLAPDDETPRENSSPVCFAHVQGLRPGFEDVSMPWQPEALQPADKAPLPAGLLAEDAGLQDVLATMQDCIRQILSPWGAGFPANPALDKQITDLVCQLFGPLKPPHQPLKRP